MMIKCWLDKDNCETREIQHSAEEAAMGNDCIFFVVCSLTPPPNFDHVSSTSSPAYNGFIVNRPWLKCDELLLNEIEEQVF